jgi:hypothetical protein
MLNESIMVSLEEPETGKDCTSALVQREGKESAHAARTNEWPKRLHADMAWEPGSFASKEDYTVSLTNNDISEIRDAVRHFNSMSRHVRRPDVR